MMSGRDKALEARPWKFWGRIRCGRQAAASAVGPAGGRCFFTHGGVAIGTGGPFLGLPAYLGRYPGSLLTTYTYIPTLCNHIS